MPRNISGVYTLPAGNPVAADTVIESVWANNTMSDLAQAMTASLDRFGSGGMLAPLHITDGSQAAPGLSFASEAGTGIYKPAAGQFAISVLGTQAFLTSDAQTRLPLATAVMGASPSAARFAVGTNAFIFAGVPGRAALEVNGAGESVLGFGIAEAQIGYLLAQPTRMLLGTLTTLPVEIGTSAGTHLSIGPAGATFTVPPIWAPAPTAAGHLANKAYVDNTVGASGFLPISGGVLTPPGNLTVTNLSADALAVAGAATIGGTLTGVSANLSGALSVMGGNSYLGGALTLNAATAALPGLTLGRVGTDPLAAWVSSGGALNQKIWDLRISGANMTFRAISDDYTVGTPWLTAIRAALAVTNVAIDATAIALNGAVTMPSAAVAGTAAVGALAVTGAATVGGQLNVTGRGIFGSHVGVGATPSPWAAGYFAVETPAAAFWSDASSTAYLSQNLYYTGSFIYKAAGRASVYAQGSDGVSRWYNAQTGAAGAVAALAERMQLDSRGNLGLGSTAPTFFGAGITTQSINGAAGASLDLQFGGAPRAQLYADNTAAILESLGTVPLVLRTGGIERLRADGVTGDVTYGGLEVGYRKLPLVAYPDGANSTVQLGDRGKAHTRTDVGVKTVIVPAAVFAGGDIVTIFNWSTAAMTIDATGLTGYLAGTTVPKTTFTITGVSMATILFKLTSAFVISGPGVS